MRLAYSAALLALLAAAASAQPDVRALPLIPAPAEVALGTGDPFVATAETLITVEPSDAEALRIGRYLADLLGSDTAETRPAVTEAEGPAPGAIHLRTNGEGHGPEGYALSVDEDGVTISASAPAGLFWGVQTLRQLLPAAVEHGAAFPQPHEVPAVEIRDRPRFGWRGAMLDVARHFRTPAEVERFVDLMALYKLNTLHLHLSDDQGWRVEIPGWPRLTEVGGSTEVGGGPGGFYTAAEYAGIVRYAAERFVTVVPEIDVPGHTNAALASYPELNCDGEARPLYTGTSVGFSTLCVEREGVYTFFDAVVGALAALTPGDFFHLGGDEVKELSARQYARFMARAQAIVAAHRKRVVGWDEIAEVDLLPDAVVQVWRAQAPAAAEAVAEAVAQGAEVVLSPSDRIYLDIKYDSTTALGLTWAGLNGVRDAYDWEPAALVAGVPEASILGVEAPLWSETLAAMSDVWFMALPRLPGVAEIAWSTREARGWDGYRHRLAAQAPRWTALGLTYFRSPEVPWDGP
jgi:hexosaminidase